MMRTQSRSYDIVAPFYDLVARLVYGNTLLRARSFLLESIGRGARILIAGGGTGWELEQISEKYPSGITIIYVDISEKMIALAKQRDTAQNEVIFIKSPIETADVSGQFDVILTPFLFDNFTQPVAENVFRKLDGLLKPGGQWLYCDFQNTKIVWQRALLRLMYLFFRICCGIPARVLPDVGQLFAGHKYEITRQAFFLKKFITAAVYRKS